MSTPSASLFPVFRSPADWVEPAATGPTLRQVTEPAEGTPAVIDQPALLQEACAQILAGHGPIAIDTERANSFRYTARAYLIQLRREGAGTFLFDPVALEAELELLAQVIADEEWILHDAGQDLPCLAEAGLRPAAIFDTEIAARILGFERFGLAAVLEEMLGVSLAKEHSAADWSTRPLPADWLRYAALDVEFLIPLRRELLAELEADGKAQWAREEFEAVRLANPPEPKAEAWRHVSGAGRVRGARGLAALRELWTVRDGIARENDLAPTVVLPNAALVAAAVHLPRNRRQLGAMPEFQNNREVRKRLDVWYAALSRAAKLPEEQLPALREVRPAGQPPQGRNWHRNHPEAAQRLDRLRQAVSERAEELEMDPMMLLAPKTVRKLAWICPEDASRGQIEELLVAAKARPWQRREVLDALYTALRRE